jgi:hypothetical protein
MTAVRGTKAENELLKRLVSECLTYDLRENQAMQYIRLQYPREISHRTYYAYKKKLVSESVALQWLNQFSKIGFVQNHHRLMVDAKRIYQDSLRRYFNEMAKGDKSNRYLIMKMEESFRANGKWLLELSMGSPIISQIKAKIEQMNRMDIKDDLEQNSENLQLESRNGDTVLVTKPTDYTKYDKLISRTDEEDEDTTNEPYDIKSGNGEQKESLDKGDNQTVTRGTEKRIRTRNDEFIEGGASTTDRVF